MSLVLKKARAKRIAWIGYIQGMLQNFKSQRSCSLFHWEGYMKSQKLDYYKVPPPFFFFLLLPTMSEIVIILWNFPFSYFFFVDTSYCVCLQQKKSTVCVCVILDHIN